MKNKVNLYNLIAVCYLWSSSGFITYLLTYYSKYFKGNFFMNYSISGLSDGFSMVWIGILSSKLELKKLLGLCNSIIILMSLVLNYVMNNGSIESQVILVPVLLMIIRLQSSAI
jgi:hypothetical protein